MARTVTVRLSVVVALLLLAAGGGTYYDAAQDTRPDPPEQSGITVEPAPDTQTGATNVTDLPRIQRALFLLAVEPSEIGDFHSADDRLREAAREMPSAVSYDEAVYAVEESEPEGWATHGALPVMEWLGMGLAIVGGLALFFLQLARLE